MPPDWDGATDGGQLVWWPVEEGSEAPRHYVDAGGGRTPRKERLEPKAGRLVLFKARTVMHEVRGARPRAPRTPLPRPPCVLAVALHLTPPCPRPNLGACRRCCPRIASDTRSRCGTLEGARREDRTSDFRPLALASFVHGQVSNSNQVADPGLQASLIKIACGGTHGGCRRSAPTW